MIATNFKRKIIRMIPVLVELQIILVSIISIPIVIMKKPSSCEYRLKPEAVLHRYIILNPRPAYGPLVCCTIRHSISKDAHQGVAILRWQEPGGWALGLKLGLLACPIGRLPENVSSPHNDYSLFPPPSGRPCDAKIPDKKGLLLAKSDIPWAAVLRPPHL